MSFNPKWSAITSSSSRSYASGNDNNYTFIAVRYIKYLWILLLGTDIEICTLDAITFGLMNKIIRADYIQSPTVC